MLNNVSFTAPTFKGLTQNLGDKDWTTTKPDQDLETLKMIKGLADSDEYHATLTEKDGRKGVVLSANDYTDKLEFVFPTVGNKISFIREEPDSEGQKTQTVIIAENFVELRKPIIKAWDALFQNMKRTAAGFKAEKERREKEYKSLGL